MWLDWYERQLEQLLSRVHFALIRRLYPELGRIRSDKDRRWALWLAAEGSSFWQKSLVFIALVFVGPAVVTVAVTAIGIRLGWSAFGGWPVICFIAWFSGFLVAAAVVETIRGRRVRSRCFLAMRIFGQDVCLSCGYDMTGHRQESPQSRLCPECGSAVPPSRDGQEGRACGISAWEKQGITGFGP